MASKLALLLDKDRPRVEVQVRPVAVAQRRLL